LNPSRRGAVLAVLLGVGLLAVGMSWWSLEVEPPATPRTGGAAPEFQLADLQGRPVALSDLRGKVVYVNFWATWCVPCRDEAPALQRLYDGLRGEGFEILAATIDAENDVAAVEAFRKQYGLLFPILLDTRKEAYTRYGATGVPETYLIDSEGRLAEAYIGPRNWDDPRYARAIRRLLAPGSGASEGRADG